MDGKGPVNCSRWQCFRLGLIMFECPKWWNFPETSCIPTQLSGILHSTRLTKTAFRSQRESSRESSIGLKHAVKNSHNYRDSGIGSQPNVSFNIGGRLRFREELNRGSLVFGKISSILVIVFLSSVSVSAESMFIMMTGLMMMRW